MKKIIRANNLIGKNIFNNPIFRPLIEKFESYNKNGYSYKDFEKYWLSTKREIKDMYEIILIECDHYTAFLPKFMCCCHDHELLKIFDQRVSKLNNKPNN